MFQRIIFIVLAALIGGAPLRAADGDTFSGTYTMTGAKGPITLILQVGDDGKVSGSLKGGDLQAVLKGFPNGDGILGTMAGADAKFLSYFQLARDGDKLQFDIVQANADGDPDFTQKSRLTFSGAAKIEAPKPEPVAPPNFAGTFKDATLTLESKVTGVGYSGTIKLAGQTFKFVAVAQDGTLRGEFESPEGKFPFEATLDGRTLKFVTDGTTYTLAKQGANPLAKPAPGNPLAKPVAAPPDATPPIAAPPIATPLPGKSTGGAAWKIYKHATGLSVRYPPDWKMDLQNGVGLLTPPDVAQSATGPMEVYLLFASGAEGVTGVDDPRVVPFIEQQMQQLAPFLQRAGETKKVIGGATPGLVLSWEGVNPAGTNVRATLMATILKGYSIALLAMGDKDKIAARESVLKEVFSSLAAGAGERDAQLVGQWKFWSYKGSSDGKFGTESTRRFRFIEDGTCLWQSAGESSGSFETGSFAGQSANGDRGQWTAANGQLFVLWADGTTGTWNYEIRATENGRRLFLTGANGKADEWMKDEG